jgi:hypothetical protein
MFGVDLTDTDIHDLASARQRLSHLALTAIEHVAPLHGLSAFARFYPELRYL